MIFIGNWCYYENLNTLYNLFFWKKILLQNKFLLYLSPSEKTPGRVVYRSGGCFRHGHQQLQNHVWPTRNWHPLYPRLWSSGKKMLLERESHVCSCAYMIRCFSDIWNIYFAKKNLIRFCLLFWIFLMMR